MDELLEPPCAVSGRASHIRRGERHLDDEALVGDGEIELVVVHGHRRVEDIDQPQPAPEHGLGFTIMMTIGPFPAAAAASSQLGG